MDYIEEKINSMEVSVSPVEVTASGTLCLVQLSPIVLLAQRQECTELVARSWNKLLTVKKPFSRE